MMVYSHEENCSTSITAEVYLSSLPLVLKARHCSVTLLVDFLAIPPIINTLFSCSYHAQPCQTKVNVNYSLFCEHYIAL